MSQHTRGPWHVYQSKDSGCVFVTDAELTSIATVFRDGPHMNPEQQANAHLLAAAPEMHFALSSLRDGGWVNYLPVHIHRLILAAIAKAEGKS